MSTDSPPAWLPASLAEKWLKLRIADQARLMGDNQRILNETAKDEAAFRDFNRRQREQFATGQNMQSTNTAPADDMQISIDSPVYNNTYHRPPSGNGWKSAIIAGAVAAGLGVPASLAYYATQTPKDSSPTQINVSPREPQTIYGLRVHRESK
jgi:hypothetical protein